MLLKMLTLMFMLMLEGADAGEEADAGGNILMILMLMLTQVEEERKERVKMGWYLAISQGTILALIFMLIRRNNVLSE